MNRNGARRVKPTWLILLAALGCGDDPYAALMEERAQAQEELVRMLQGIKTAQDLQSASETLSNSFHRLAETTTKMNRMRPPSKETTEALVKQFGKRMEAAVEDSKREIRRISELPGGKVFFERLANLK